MPDSPLSSKNPQKIAEMFSAVSPRYDLLNAILSLGQDRRWRKTAALSALRLCPPDNKNIKILDLGSGTGSLSIAFCRDAERLGLKCKITALDMSSGMLALSRKKSSGTAADTIREINSNAMRLPFKNESFDIIASAFSVRNMPELPKLMRGCNRILKKNGVVAILEFLPEEPGKMNPLNRLYLSRILPLVGNTLSKSRHRAYSYLFKSIMDYYTREQFRRILEESGLSGVVVRKIAFDVVTLTLGVKPV